MAKSKILSEKDVLVEMPADEELQPVSKKRGRLPKVKLEEDAEKAAVGDHSS